MAPYLDASTFADLTLAPREYVTEIETLYPGWLVAQLAYWSAWIDSRLSKRYAAPFNAPYPIAVTGWLARIVTFRLYLKRGIDPSDAQIDTIRDEAKEAEKEIKEASEAQTGLFELPLRADTTAQGITKGRVLTYSEASPYTYLTVQRNAAELEDG